MSDPRYIPFRQNYDGVWCQEEGHSEVIYFSWEAVTCDQPNIAWEDGPCDIADGEWE